jgi:pimeloyl-ACP methyl ester carboxylesterase
MSKYHETKQLMRSLLLLLLSGLFPLQAANLSLERRISEELDRSNLSGEAVWLEANGMRFLALYSPSKNRASLGGAVILHDAGTHADWKEVIHPLRTDLSDQGWNTLSLQLPTSHSGASPSTTLSLLEKASPRIRAAIDYFSPQQQPTLVVVGHGLGGAMALYHLAKQPDQRIKAVAAISLSIDLENEADPVRQAITQLQLPLLDLYGSRDLPTVLRSAAKRRQLASENEKSNYRQEQVNGASHFFTGQQTNLTKRIHAWIKKSSGATAVE